jgi:AraC-like DNA-binding protein
MLYISPDAVKSLASEVAGREMNTLFFLDPIILDSELAQHYLEFHRASQGTTSRLEQDSLLQSLLARLFINHADTIVEFSSIGSERQAIRCVREYLQDHYGEDVTLNRLAEIADLSAYYLSRVFKAEVGISLKQYQAQVRIDRAKTLISKGTSLQQVASDTGFVDQSHMTHQFKRFVQTTPGQYRLLDRKNLQDTTE